VNASRKADGEKDEDGGRISTGPLGESGVRTEDRSDHRAPPERGPSREPTLLAPSSPPPGDSLEVDVTLKASPAGAPADLSPGSVLDGVYRVEKQIGRGAMGTVYLVEHLRLGRKFAAKVVSDRLALDEALAHRLRNEARVASRIQHENIVDVTHLGQTPSGALFIVMELLSGKDLRETLVERREKGETPWLPDEELRSIASDMMAGLAAAHAAGVVHRDLKPDNVFLEQRDGRLRAKLVDFGIAKVQQSDEDLRLTRTGQIIGTPLYMSPEQARSSAEVDTRSDIYSLGAVLYELVTGRLPLEAKSLYDIIVKHATEPPEPPHIHRPDVLPAVEGVILRCLAKRPDDRFATVEAMRKAWDEAWQGLGASEPRTLPPTPVAIAPAGERRDAAPTRTPFALVAVGVLGLVAVVAIGVTVSGGGDGAPVAPPEAPPRPESRPPPLSHPPLEARPETPPTVGLDRPVAARVERTIATTPPGATVRIGGQDVGATPYAIDVAGGPVEVELRMRGYRREVRTIAAGDPDTTTIALRRAQDAVRPELAPR
jgi:serine/threonine-protein kinase